jgi:hypothetical protein
VEEMFKPLTTFMESDQGDSVKKIGAIVLLMFLSFQGIMFWRYSQRMAIGMSQPSIMFQATLRDGST